MMPNIKPVSDLRNYNEVLRDIAVGEPVFLTKNGRGRYAIVDMEEFEYVTPASMDDRVIADYDFFSNRNGYVPIREKYADIMEYLRKCYKDMVDAGIPEEDARYILPNACCTNIIVTVNARELRHMAEERMCAKAQWEIRQLVTEMVRQAKEVAPTIFADAGPKCLKTHVCHERNGCGRYPKHVVIE